jgi:hypothetical protein
MSSFGWSTTFREGQWRIFREFVTQERQDCGSRERVIRAEQKRIGEILVLYAQDEEGKTTERRAGMMVMGNQNCAVGKLLQAYVALGGNPFDISMFLRPNRGKVEDGVYSDELQPAGGSVYKLGFSYSLSSANKNSDSSISSFRPSKVGGEVATGEERLWTPIRMLRGWCQKEMYQKRVRIEERIIKLSDLYEQLEEERVSMTQATRGEGMTNPYDTRLYSDRLSVQYLVWLVDSAWRVQDEDGRVRPDAEVNSEGLGGYPNLISDIEEDRFNAL